MAMMAELLAAEPSTDAKIERCELSGIRAVHFVIHGLLSAGVSSASKVDALGKVSNSNPGKGIPITANVSVREQECCRVPQGASCPNPQKILRCAYQA